MIRTVSCDPGTLQAGYAMFEDSMLVDVYLARADSKNLAERLLTLSVGATDWIRGRTVNTYVTERPRKYPEDRVDPNDLITLAISVGVGVAIAAQTADTIEMVFPSDWKGQSKKSQVENIVKLTLSKQERALLDHYKWNHNVVEAVGIGLHSLKRKPRRLL